MYSKMQKKVIAPFLHRNSMIQYIRAEPRRIAQSVARLTEAPEVPSSVPGPSTFFRGN